MAARNAIKIEINTVVNGSNSVVNITNELNALKEAMAQVNNVASHGNHSLESFLGGMANFSIAVQAFQKSLDDLSTQYISFDKAMRAANTMAGKSGEEFGKLKKQVKELASEIPLAREELANGLYQVISNGVPEDNWITFLRTSARSAVGGIADLGGVVTVTSTIIKNYGLSWEAALDIQDKIQLTAKMGVTSFEQMQQSLPKVAGSAAQLGVTLDELLATFATLTGVTGSTSEVATQLAAVLNALIKPSSQAQKMAEAMGFQFNAASIQAAGGLRNFLIQLDAAVKKYAEANNVLSDAVYGKLFGSAESLRAVNALTGELADNFVEKIEEMKNSAGTMAAAYDDMSTSTEANSQRMKNNIAAMTDWIGSVAAAIKPVVDYVAALGMAVIGINGLSKALKLMEASTVATTVAEVARNIATKIGVALDIAAAQAVGLLTKATKGAIVATKGLTSAIKTLMAATVIGALIAGVSAMLSLFSGTTKEASQEVDEFAEHIKELKRETSDYSKIAGRIAAEERSRLDSLYSIAKDETKSKKMRQDAMAELKRTWPEYFNQLSAERIEVDKLAAAYKDLAQNIDLKAQQQAITELLAENYKKLIPLKQGRDYADNQIHTWDELIKAAGQDIIEETETEISDFLHGRDNGSTVPIPRQRTLPDLNQPDNTSDDIVAAANKRLADLGFTVNGLESLGISDKSVPQFTTREGIEQFLSEAERNALIHTKDRIQKDVEIKAIEDSNAFLNNEAVRLAEAAKIYGNINLKDDDGDKGNTLIANPKTLKDYQHNISVGEGRLTNDDPNEQKELRAQIALWKEKAAAIKESLELADLPAEVNTLQDVSKWITYVTKQRDKATGETRDQYNQQLEGLEKLRTEMSKVKFTPKEVSEITTYEDLSKHLDYYNEQLKKAAPEQRTAILQHIADLEKLQKQWDEVADAVKRIKPASTDQLNTTKDLNEALSYYSDLQQRQSAEEYASTQLIINAIQRKLNQIKKTGDLLSDLTKYDKLKDLDGKEYKITIKTFGLERILADIRTIDRALADTSLPENVRQQLKEWKKELQKYASDSVDAFTEVREGWSIATSMESSLTSLTQKVIDHGTAWEITKSAIDTAFQIYDGISQIVTMIDTLTAAKTVESVVEQENTLETKANTTAKVENAAAGFFAAHSWIPWVGVGLAAASVAMMIATMTGLIKFADGGIAYGPTLGLFGEYQGARSNPEVVAPLSKLRSMLDHDGVGGEVEFKIKGENLVGVLNRRNRHVSRS